VSQLLKLELRHNPSWFYCQRNDQCEVIEAICGYKTAVAVGHRAAYEKQFRLSAENPLCPPVSPRPVVAKCFRNFCSPEFN